jgi:starch synthase
MKVLYIAAECKPFAKAGGVGDVAGELPLALRAQGVDIEIVTPWYGCTAIGEHQVEASGSYEVEFHGRMERAEILRTDLKGVPVNFIRNRTYFETDYSQSGSVAPFPSALLFKKDYSRPYVDSESIPFFDDALRFSFFSEACLGLIGQKNPAIVHVNDWVLGFLFGRMVMQGRSQKRILSVHNIGYQGNIGRVSIADWEIQRIAENRIVGPLFSDPRPEWQSVNALRLALELAHQTNTVSPNYKKEITRSEDQSRYFEGAKGLERVTAKLDAAGKLHGILNGFEYAFAPTDQRFQEVLAEKAKIKALLSGGFPHPDGLLLGFVGRAVEQKFKLLTEKLDGKSVLEHILDLPGINVAILANGLKEYEDFLRGLAGRPNFSATIAFDRAKAGQISLGSDVFLMPSLFEPCGITQMESLSCATPPLVRWTGGLVDTVIEHTDPAGTGFGFDGATAREVLVNLVGAVKNAERFYAQDKDGFRNLQRRGFDQRFLWSAAAKEYIGKMYEPALAAT